MAIMWGINIENIATNYVQQRLLWRPFFQSVTVRNMLKSHCLNPIRKPFLIEPRRETTFGLSRILYVSKNVKFK